MTSDALITLVREYGRERYRHGKADVRKKLAKTKAQRRQSAKAKQHAEIAAAIMRTIESELTPYITSI